ncbi:MAG: hypothetical protein V1792_09825 [Pseudomonadota bacterium]
MREIWVGVDAECKHANRVRDAVNLINGCQSYFFLRFLDDQVRLQQTSGVITGDSVAQQIAQSFPDRQLVVVTDRPYDDDWFSHEHRHCAVITTADWEESYAPPSLRTYLMYQIAQAMIPLEGDLSEEMLLRLVHEPAVGCMNDMVDDKPDIKYGMVAGYLCFECEGTLRKFGVALSALDAIRQMLLLVRAEAIARPRIVDPLSAFVVMRFSRNDENDNAYKYGVVPGLNDVGICPKRADDNVESRQILHKIFREMDRSRFTIAKVDVDNLNVYFELGLAMGLSKDVLLISEETLTLSLPSDLRNWECLIYQKGNYQQLRQRVAQFFRNSYHLGHSTPP